MSEQGTGGAYTEERAWTCEVGRTFFTVQQVGESWVFTECPDDDEPPTKVFVDSLGGRVFLYADRGDWPIDISLDDFEEWIRKHGLPDGTKGEDLDLVRD